MNDNSSTRADATAHIRGELHIADLAAVIHANVVAALTEDLGVDVWKGTGSRSADVTATLIQSDTRAVGRVITREPGVMCGAAWAEQTAALIDPELHIDWQVADGERLTSDQMLFEIHGNARAILTAERTMLNFIQLLSGTASQTARYVELVEGTKAKVLDTRKTIPGLRMAQKYAVTTGGGYNHRIGLFDAFLIKENHIAAAGSIAAAVAQAHASHPDLPLEVEVERIEQMFEAIDAGADIVMLDNFDLTQTAAAVAANNGAVKLEASGNVDENTITDIARTGVDYISSGNLTKKVVPLDLSMRFTSAS